MSRDQYHHGDLRRTILAAAVDVIAESGPAALSLRDLARRVGVSHAAPRHHFGDKAGLLTAVAAEGFDLLADRVAAADGDILDAGVAYIRFATEHPGHFAVIFTPALYHADSPDVIAAQNRAGQALRDGLRSVRPDPDRKEQTALAAWSIAHGFATLWLSGALRATLPDDTPDDPARVGLDVIKLLFQKD